jgi:hypothetical protein
MGGSARTNRGLVQHEPSSFSSRRLPAPPAPGTAPGQTVNPPVAEQPRGNRCGYAKYDVADHGLPGEGIRVGRGSLFDRAKPYLRSWGRRGSAARPGPPLPPVGGVNALRSRSAAFALLLHRRTGEADQRPLFRAWASTSAPSLMLRTASAKPFLVGSVEDGALIAAGMSTTVASSRKSGMPRRRARTEA